MRKEGQGSQPRRTAGLLVAFPRLGPLPTCLERLNLLNWTPMEGASESQAWRGWQTNPLSWREGIRWVPCGLQNKEVPLGMVCG